MLFPAKLNIFMLFACVLFSSSASCAVDNDEPIGQGQPVPGQSIIQLDEATQKLSGLQTLTLEAVNYHPEFPAYGKALNIQPLFALRHQYLASLSEHQSASAKFNLAEQSVNRQQTLYRQDIVSKRSLQSQQAQWQTDKAQRDASKFRIKALYDEALINWGKELTEWALSPNVDKLADFLSGRRTLLQINLTANRHLATGVNDIYVEASGARGKASKATLISVAPQTDNAVQGESYFFQTSATNIRPGMRVAAWIAQLDQNQSGVIIPKSALIWHLDQAFVYIKTDKEQFSRRPIAQFTETTEGYFISTDISPGEQVVATGGQMLLSEEFRAQIPDEDED